MSGVSSGPPFLGGEGASLGSPAGLCCPRAAGRRLPSLCLVPLPGLSRGFFLTPPPAAQLRSWGKTSQEGGLDSLPHPPGQLPFPTS